MIIIYLNHLHGLLDQTFSLGKQRCVMKHKRTQILMMISVETFLNEVVFTTIYNSSMNVYDISV